LPNGRRTGLGFNHRLSTSIEGKAWMIRELHYYYYYYYYYYYHHHHHQQQEDDHHPTPLT